MVRERVVAGRTMLRTLREHTNEHRRQPETDAVLVF